MDPAKPTHEANYMRRIYVGGTRIHWFTIQHGTGQDRHAMSLAIQDTIYLCPSLPFLSIGTDTLRVLLFLFFFLLFQLSRPASSSRSCIKPVSIRGNTHTIKGKRNIPLASERPDAPVTAANILRVKVIDIPPQTPEDILARLQQDIKLAARLLAHPLNIPLHVELRVPRRDDGHLGLEQLRERLLPLVAARRVAQARVEEDEAVEVGVVRLKVPAPVDRVVVVDDGADLHARRHAVLDNHAERVRRRARRQRELVVPVRHALRADEDEVNPALGEEVRQLHPDVARQRRFRTRAQAEHADRRGRQS